MVRRCGVRGVSVGLVTLPHILLLSGEDGDVGTYRASFLPFLQFRHHGMVPPIKVLVFCPQLSLFGIGLQDTYRSVLGASKSSQIDSDG